MLVGQHRQAEPLSRGRGIGFFEAGNFHPDFIVWQLVPGRQHVSFVDPKGIRNLPPDDPKITFYETVKGIETRLGDPNVVLDSFIVSNTASHVMRKQWGIGKPEMVQCHILFQDEDRAGYIAAMLLTRFACSRALMESRGRRRGAVHRLAQPCVECCVS